MVASELPQEILIDIFSRLPVKSVGQCRCLSKSWRDILSSPHFIKSHLSRQTHQESLLLLGASRSFHYIDTINDGAVSRELQLPPDYSNTEIVGSCDGLVLLVNRYNDMFLVNPVTLEKVRIPNSPLALKDVEKEGFTMHGFGCDSSNDDYKIVTLSYYKVEVDDEDDQEPDCDETFVDVYSVKRGAWERVESSPYNHFIPEPHSGAFFNGAIHWLARTRESSHRSVLVAFNLSAEAFTEIPIPDDIKVEAICSCQVVVLGGCLCIIDVRYGTQTYVWVMKDYGLVESWTKLSKGTCDQWGIGKPLCFVGDQEIVSVVYGKPLRVYNPKERTLRNMIFDGVVTTLVDGVIFVPSLVSPDNEASLPHDARRKASAGRLALALTIQSVLIQRPKDSADIQQLFEMLCDRFMPTGLGKALINEMCRQSVEAYETSNEFRSDFFGNVVRLCRRHLRESGHFNEDVVMLVGRGVPDSC